MASQVLSGSSNVSYTNNTGQNVRIIINYMANPSAMSWTSTSGGSVTPVLPNSVGAIGRNLAFNNGLSGYTGALSANNGANIEGYESTNFALPTEIMLAPGQTFSATCGPHNIVVIPENG